MRRRRRKGLTGSAGTGSKTTTTNSSTKSNDGLFCLKAPELPRQTRHSPRFSPTVTGDEAELIYQQYVVPRRNFEGLVQAERDFDQYRKTMQTLLNNMNTAQTSAMQEGERRAQ